VRVLPVLPLPHPLPPLSNYKTQEGQGGVKNAAVVCDEHRGLSAGRCHVIEIH
jgi:hypothetical protein